MISEVYNEDCVEGMKRFPDNYFDLAIVDPPYGINATTMKMGSAPNRKDGKGYSSVGTAQKLKGRLNSGGGKLKDRMLNKSSFSWDNEIPSAEYFEQLFRVSKNQIIWGGNYFPLPPTRCIICWDKVQPWENFSQWEMAWTSFDKPAKMYRISNTGGANRVEKIHPTQKPVGLYTLIIRDFIPVLEWPSSKILDTHFGSGSSRVAAHKMNKDYYGFEINEKYFKDAQRWYDTESAQLSIWNT